MTERSQQPPHRQRPPDVEEALSSMLWTPYERTPTDSSSEDELERRARKQKQQQQQEHLHPHQHQQNSLRRLRLSQSCYEQRNDVAAYVALAGNYFENVDDVNMNETTMSVICSDRNPIEQLQPYNSLIRNSTPAFIQTAPALPLSASQPPPPSRQPQQQRLPFVPFPNFNLSSASFITTEHNSLLPVTSTIDRISAAPAPASVLTPTLTTTSMDYNKTYESEACPNRYSYPYYGPIPSLTKWWSSGATTSLLKEPPSYESLYTKTEMSTNSLQPVLDNLKLTNGSTSSAQLNEHKDICDRSNRSEIVLNTIATTTTTTTIIPTTTTTTTVTTISTRNTDNVPTERLVHSFTDDFITQHCTPVATTTTTLSTEMFQQQTRKQHVPTNVDEKKQNAMTNRNCNIDKQQTTTSEANEEIILKENATNMRSQQNIENPNNNNNNNSINKGKSKEQEHEKEHNHSTIEETTANEETDINDVVLVVQVNQPVSCSSSTPTKTTTETTPISISEHYVTTTATPTTTTTMATQSSTQRATTISNSTTFTPTKALSSLAESKPVSLLTTAPESLTLSRSPHSSLSCCDKATITNDEWLTERMMNTVAISLPSSFDEYGTIFPFHSNDNFLTLSDSLSSSLSSSSSTSSSLSYRDSCIITNSYYYGNRNENAFNVNRDSGGISNLTPNKCLAELERLYAEFRASESIYERKLKEHNKTEIEISTTSTSTPTITATATTTTMRLNIPATIATNVGSNVAVMTTGAPTTCSSVFLGATATPTTTNELCANGKIVCNNNNNNNSSNSNGNCNANGNNYIDNCNAKSVSNISILSAAPATPTAPTATNGSKSCKRQPSLTIQVNNNNNNNNNNTSNGVSNNGTNVCVSSSTTTTNQIAVNQQQQQQDATIVSHSKQNNCNANGNISVVNCNYVHINNNSNNNNQNKYNKNVLASVIDVNNVSASLSPSSSASSSGVHIINTQSHSSPVPQVFRASSVENHNNNNNNNAIINSVVNAFNVNHNLHNNNNNENNKNNENNNNNENNENNEKIKCADSVNIININNTTPTTTTATSAILNQSNQNNNNNSNNNKSITTSTATTTTLSNTAAVAAAFAAAPTRTLPTPARTFTSTECQTDEISTTAMPVHSSSNNIHNNNNGNGSGGNGAAGNGVAGNGAVASSREQRRRERRERRQQQQQLQLIAPVPHSRRHGDRNSLHGASGQQVPPPLGHLHPTHMHHAAATIMPNAAILRPMLPDILHHSHYPPPYSALPSNGGPTSLPLSAAAVAAGIPPPSSSLLGAQGPPSLPGPPQAPLPPPGAPPPGATILTPMISTLPLPSTTTLLSNAGRISLPLPIMRRSPSERSGKGCCGQWFAGPPLRALIAVVALGGVACALGGAALGATGLAGPPNSHLTAALLMIGVGVVLVTVSGAAWRMTAPGGQTCLGLGSSVDLGRCGRRPCSRGGGAPHGLLYPEFQHRPPPPSYQASMQEYRLRLLLLDRDRQHGVIRGNSPPPTYRSHAGSLLRAPLTTLRGGGGVGSGSGGGNGGGGSGVGGGGASSIYGSEYSLPPSYRSRNATPASICTERTIETAPSGRLLANEDIPEPSCTDQLPDYSSLQSNTLLTSAIVEIETCNRSEQNEASSPASMTSSEGNNNKKMTNKTQNKQQHKDNNNQTTTTTTTTTKAKDLVTIVTISQAESNAAATAANASANQAMHSPLIGRATMEQIDILAHL